MHRQRTKLVKRVNRVASSVERRGIVATYQVHDRLLGNRSARRRFASHVPELDETQRTIVEALDRDGYVTLPFTDLPRTSSGRRSTPRAPRSSQRRSATLAEGGQGQGARRARSSSSAHTASRAPHSAPDDPWFSFCASRRMLDVANAYLRLWSKLSYVDLWYTAQQPASDERVASQNWHVDFDDKHLLKAFVYLSDVGAGTWAVRVRPGKPARRAAPFGAALEADGATAGCRTSTSSESVPAEEIATFTGPKGTLILCNTSGLHRGGFATAGPRVLATATYCSPASLKALSNRNYSTTLETTDPVVRYAVS